MVKLTILPSFRTKPSWIGNAHTEYDLIMEVISVQDFCRQRGLILLPFLYCLVMSGPSQNLSRLRRLIRCAAGVGLSLGNLRMCSNRLASTRSYGSIINAFQSSAQRLGVWTSDWTDIRLDDMLTYSVSGRVFPRTCNSQ